ncbi:hypothetical protein SSABA_v1c07770 [Spiroplasma sabaudiense Ar-1343]|uniref:Uncharacterized protein n=1 Tax=Spiroplasma sabaudiense Ar-1343 TaxID=1276257 RepID=W6AKC7_9MOLU|nr:hypothetical protein [Spiroplasma sabaudiense]AHI54179.1 hypothetical protein SSABA_v1c07770 [Spiroplasma sabaudiense Ar-1343]
MKDIYWILIGLALLAIAFGIAGIALVIKNSKKTEKKNLKSQSLLNHYDTNLDDFKKISKDFLKNVKIETNLDYFGNSVKTGLQFSPNFLKKLNLELDEEKLETLNKKIAELWNNTYETIEKSVLDLENLFNEKTQELQDQIEIKPILVNAYVSGLNEILIIFKDNFVSDIFALKLALMLDDQNLIPKSGEKIDLKNLKSKIADFKAKLKQLVKMLEKDLKK